MSKVDVPDRVRIRAMKACTSGDMELFNLNAGCISDNPRPCTRAQDASRARPYASTKPSALCA